MKTLHRTIFAVLTVAALAVSASGAAPRAKHPAKRTLPAAHRKVTLSAFTLLPIQRPLRTPPVGARSSALTAEVTASS